MSGLINSNLCAKWYCLANPAYIYWIIPLAFILATLSWVTLVKFKKDEEKAAFVRTHRLDRIFFVIIRSIVFLLLLIAVASPYALKETTTEGNPSLTILADNSSSFQIFDTTIAPKLKESLEQYFPVDIKYIASKERSPIGDGILQNAEGDDHLLVVSDGYNNYGRSLGDIILFSNILNTSIHTLKMEPIRKDVSVTIDGPPQVIEQSESKFKVNVLNVGDVKYSKLEVFVDGSQVSLDGEGRFTWRFSRGYHKVMARILFPNDDYFEQNNIYYKSVKALPRPKLLLVAEGRGPLQEALEKIYDVNAEADIPDEVGGYDAVILNDINVNKISDSKVDLLSDYLSEKGRGLVVVGGENSFDNGGYKGSYFESLLPVKVGVWERRRDERYNVVFVIDLSWSVSGPFKLGDPTSVLDFEKAFMLEIINNLNLDDKIAIFSFDVNAHCIPKGYCVLHEIATIPKLEGTIRSLQVPPGEPSTHIASGLAKARQILKMAQGSRNIVLLSDGGDTDPGSVIRQIDIINTYGIKLYTVGIGFKVKRDNLKSWALRGGGLYLEPDESEKLKIIFMGDEDEQRCAKAKSGRVILMDTSHWITKGDLSLNVNVGGYNLVVPELWGRKLVATDCDRTIMTAGRYGLGRVVVLSTDDGSKWSGSMFSRENSKIITRMVNWAIGDFTKDSEFDVRVKDTTLGRSAAVNVVSNEKPEEKDLDFVKLDAGLYSANFIPKEEGFYHLLGATLGVSYNDEYERIGMNPELEELVTISGGYVFRPEETEKIRNTVISMSKRVKAETINYRWPFIIAALILFLADVLVRRIRENTNLIKF